MNDLGKARDLLQRSISHLKWARDNRAKAWQKEREESLRVSDFYEDAEAFLQATSPKANEG